MSPPVYATSNHMWFKSAKAKTNGKGWDLCKKHLSASRHKGLTFDGRGGTDAMGVEAVAPVYRDILWTSRERIKLKCMQVTEIKHLL